MVWLGFDYDQVRQAEIGSRHEHSSKKAPIKVFQEKMLPAMKIISRVLKPSKLAYVLIGDSVIDGQHIDMSELFIDLGKQCGLKNIDCVDYDLSKISRSFREKTSANSHGGAINKDKRQHILVFESISQGGVIDTGRAKSSPKSSWALRSLDGPIDDGLRTYEGNASTRSRTNYIRWSDFASGDPNHRGMCCRVQFGPCALSR